MTDRQLLWRVVFCSTRSVLCDPFSAGPWHPDKAQVQAWVEWFRRHGHSASLQNNRDAARRRLLPDDDGPREDLSEQLVL